MAYDYIADKNPFNTAITTKKMKKHFTLVDGLFLLMLLLSFAIKSISAKKVIAVTSPQTKHTYVNDGQLGKRKIEIKMEKGDRIMLK